MHQRPDHASVIVIGSINIDRVLRVQALPTPGETIVATSESTLLGGKGANQAIVAGSLAKSVAMVGVVGNDTAGSNARAALETVGVNTRHLLSRNTPTGTATVVVEDSGENTIVIRRGANELLTPERVASAIAALADASSIVVASLEIPVAAVIAAAAAAATAGARFVLNPAPAQILDPALLPLCAVLVPNAGEFRHIASSASELFDAGVGAVVVTRGAAGAELIERGSAPVVVSPPGVDVLDTTGAGDAFVAALAVALHDDLLLSDAVAVAVTAGAVATTGLGAQGSIPTRARIGELVAGRQAITAWVGARSARAGATT